MDVSRSRIDIVSETFIMPEEGEPHTATWMAYGATIDTWGTASIYGANRLIARKDLIRIAANLSRFEKVKMLINGYDFKEASEFLNQIRNEDARFNSGGNRVPKIEAAGKIEFIKKSINDLWVRDTGPVFVFDHNRIPHGINFNFNGWGQRNTCENGWKKCPIKASNEIPDQRIKEDQQVADFIIRYAGVKKISTWLCMEGGGVEVNGKGTAICTESCILNTNRNPGKSKEDVEKELLRLLGINKVIWLPGLKGKDITDGHIDFYARFVDESKVVYSLDKDLKSPDYAITLLNQQVLNNSTDALGNKIIAIPLIVPDFTKVRAAVNSRNGWNDKKSFFNANDFAGGYVGFYLANNCVLMSKFGDANADKAALDILTGIYPDRTVIQITTDGVASGGGTIHCATQQQI